MPTDRSLVSRFLVASSLVALLLPACTQSASRRPVARAQDVQAAAGALRSDGNGLILFASDGRDSEAGDEGLFEMVVTRDGSIHPPKKALAETGAFALQVTFGASEQAHAVWLVPASGLGPVGHLHASARAGGWGAVETIDDGPIAEGAFDLAGDAAGGALLAWESDGSLVACVAGPGAPFGTPVVLLAAAGTQGVWTPRVALDPTGRGIVACHWVAAPDEIELLAWSFDPVGGFAPLGRIDAAQEGVTLDVAVAAAADGTFALAWNEPGGSETPIVVRRVATDGALQPIEVAQPARGSEQRIELEFEDDGSLLVAWSNGDDVAWRRSLAGGAWGAAQLANVAASFDLFRTVHDVSGRVTALGFGSKGGGPPAIHGGRNPDGGLATISQLLATTDPAPQGLGLLHGGPVALAFWIFDDTLELYVWVDPTASFSFDPFPIAGESVRFDASECAARTTETGIAIYQWDFDGDGAFDVATTDVATDHVFTKSGSNPVKLVVVDDWGDHATKLETAEVRGGPDIDPPWELTVALEGDGAVSSDFDDDGTLEIDAPGVSVASFADGVYVFLEPAPSAGFHLDHWEGLSLTKGDGDYGSDGCVVHMTSDRSVKAVFEPD